MQKMAFTHKDVFYFFYFFTIITLDYKLAIKISTIYEAPSSFFLDVKVKIKEVIAFDAPKIQYLQVVFITTIDIPSIEKSEYLKMFLINWNQFSGYAKNVHKFLKC